VVPSSYTLRGDFNNFHLPTLNLQHMDLAFNSPLNVLEGTCAAQGCLGFYVFNFHLPTSIFQLPTKKAFSFFNLHLNYIIKTFTSYHHNVKVLFIKKLSTYSFEAYLQTNMIGLSFDSRTNKAFNK
jgi:hypothetical protein